MGIKAAILDFDGVIVDSEKAKFESLKTLLKAKGIILKSKDFPDMVGKKTKLFLKEKFEKELSDKAIEAIEKKRRDYQMKHLKKYCKPIPGAKECIKFLKRNNLKLCLATGTKRMVVNKVIKMLGLKSYFDAFVTGEEFKSSKPNPGVYRIAIKKLKIPKKHIIVIEDSAAGVMSAKKAGLKCIAITTTQRKKQLKRADIIVSSFKNMKKHLTF